MEKREPTPAGPVTVSYCESEVPAALAPYVRALWRLRAPATAAKPPEPPEPIIPDGCVEIVLSFGDPMRQHDPGAAPVLQPPAMIAGAIDRPTVVAPTGEVDIWGCGSTRGRRAPSSAPAPPSCAAARWRSATCRPRWPPRSRRRGSTPPARGKARS